MGVPEQGRIPWWPPTRHSRAGAVLGRLLASLRLLPGIGVAADGVFSAAHLAHAQRIAHIGSAHLDLIHGRDQWSDELYRLIGVEPRSIPPNQETFLQFVHPDDRDTVRRALSEARLGRAAPPVEYRVVRPSGEVRWLYRLSELVSHAHGRPVAAVITVQDITDRKQAEAALQLSQAQLRRNREHLAQAQRVGMVGSAEFELASKRHTWSDELYRLFGLEPGSVAPGFMQFLELVVPEDRDLVIAAQAATRDGRPAPAFEFRIRRRDGELRWLRRQSDVLSYEGGTPTTIIIAFQDITESKRAALELAEREDQLRLSQEHLTIAQRIAAQGSAEIDLGSGKVYWSDEHFSLLGVPKGSIPNTVESLLNFVHPEDRDTLRRAMARALEGDDVAPLEFRILRYDGQLRWIRRVQDFIEDGAGKPFKLVATLQDVTERKSIEAALQQREAQLLAHREHLARAQQVGMIGSAEVDLQTGATIWSDQLYALFGVDPAKAVPSFMTLLSILPPAMHELAQRMHASEMNGIPSPPAEVEIIRPDGQRRWLYRQVDIVSDQAGKATELIATYQDITERRRMEEELRRSREHLTLAQRVGRIGSAEVDLASGQVMWSDGLFAVLGLDPATAVPGRETFLDRIHPDDRDTVIRHREATFHGDGTPPLEFRVVRPDGEVRWLYHKVEIVRGADGKPAKLVGTDQDITEFKQATLDLREREAQLRNSQRHLDLAQRVGKIGSVEIATDTRRSHWSDEMYALLGLDPATTEAGEAALLAVVHPDDREEMRRRRERLVQGVTNVPFQFRVIRPDNGEVRWLQVQSGPAEGDTGRSPTMVGTFQDVTELRRAQTERAEIERQLMQAQKMEAVGNLTGGIAHDFNNLLTVILGRLDLVESELEDRPELREWVRICSRAARRGATLTRSMMAFARQQPLRPVAVDLAASIGDMVGLLQRSLGEAIEIITVYATGLWRCEADPSQLQSALLNLALNARDAMPQGGRLTIDARNVRLDADYAARNADVLPGDYVMMSVSDTGSGMSREVAERAFEPFFTTKAVGKGSGLGLSMVYGFVKQSGGHVKIYSEPGFGTTIRLYLPRSNDEPAAPVEDETEASSLPSGNHETILVVEDDQDMRELAVAVLERLGYRPLGAADPDRALDLFERHDEIALLLTDISLPGGLNGRTLAERMQRSRPGLKVLYMSGYSEDAVIHQGRLDPGVRLLQKPFNNDELATQIRAALTSA